MAESDWGVLEEAEFPLIPEDGAPEESPLAEPSDPRFLDPEWPRCQYCGEPIEDWKGSGRRPKFHAEHRPSVMEKGGSSRTSSEKGSEKALNASLKRLSAELGENIRLIGAIATPAVPITGFIVMRDADQCASAVVKLARNNPAILKALEKASQVGPGVALGKFFLTIGVAMAVDTQRLIPDSQLAVALGITAVVNEMASSGAEPVFMAPPPVAQYV